MNKGNLHILFNNELLKFKVIYLILNSFPLQFFKLFRINIRTEVPYVRTIITIAFYKLL